MKYLDLFAGYGGFSLGIQQAYEDNRGFLQGKAAEGIREDSADIKSGQVRPACIGFSEIDKYATQVYKHKFPTHKEYGDITKLDPTTLPEFDLLCGGFPCQAFSIAGKRAGFEDTRGTLIYDVFRIIKEKHPKLVLLENVKGLLSHDNGRTFKTIITSLAELGYAVEWQVLNAKNFGVPQNRERVFIIGHLGGFSGRQVFPIGESNGSHLKEITRGVSDDQRIYDPKGIAKSQKALGGGLGAKTGLYAIGGLQDHQHPRIDGNSPCLPSAMGMGGGHTPIVGEIGECKIRRLTPIECERLMGLPDGWTEGVSDTQRYKLCGNGVVVNVVKEIIKRLI
jgi:DNA (cytosine-5)-methyltransferase 1